MRQLTVFLLLFTAQLLPAFGQQLNNDPNVLVGQLHAGLHYYIQPYQGEPGKASFYLVSKVGSLTEQDHQSGYAHFLSQLHVAGGSAMHADGIQTLWLKLKLEPNELVQSGYVANVYKIPVTVHPSIVADVLDFFGGVIQPTALDSTVFATLQQQVISDIKEEQQSTKGRVMSQLTPFQLQDSRYASRPITGTLAAIEAMRLPNLTDFEAQVSDPAKFALIVVGDLDADTLLSEIKKRFAHLHTSEAAGFPTAKPIAVSSDPAYVCVTDSAVNQVSVNLAVGFAETGIQNKQDVHRMKSLEMVNEVMKTAFSQFAEKDSCLAHASFKYARMEFGLTQLSLNVDAAEASALKACLSAAYAVLREFSTDGIPTSLVDAARQTISTRDQQLYDARDRVYTRFLADRLVNRFLYSYPQPDLTENYRLQKTALAAVTAPDVQQWLQQFVDAEKRTFIVAPKSTENQLPSAQELTKWITMNN